MSFSKIEKQLDSTEMDFGGDADDTADDVKIEIESDFFECIVANYTFHSLITERFIKAIYRLPHLYNESPLIPIFCPPPNAW